MSIDPDTHAQQRATLLESVTQRAFAQMNAMIWLANNRKDKEPGDPKVGGHPASCASSLHILGALHLVARDPHDFICCKPHAAPMDHAFGHLLGVFRHPDGTLFNEDEAKGVMTRLRKFPEEPGQPVFQSYHADKDPDSFHFLPSGSVGIPPVASGYLALAHRYGRDHGYEFANRAHYWSLIGDSEFREGSLLEAMPDLAERKLGNVTWIIDYNRQNLDGTRIPNTKSHETRDCDRIEAMSKANDWEVIQLRHGSYRKELFDGAGGAALKHWIEDVLPDYDYQLLLFGRNADAIRDSAKRDHEGAYKVLADLSDEAVLRFLGDVGGHDIMAIAKAMEDSRIDQKTPTMLIVHTVKGYGLECYADPSNHSTLPSKKELTSILESNGLTDEDPFGMFAEDSDEAAFLRHRGGELLEGMQAVRDLAMKNKEEWRNKFQSQGGVPDSLNIDLSLYPMVNTQWMWGQLASKLIRIGTRDQGGPVMAGADRDLTDEEQRWKMAAEMVVTMSPDVGTSTNLSPGMDSRIYGPDDCEGDTCPIPGTGRQFDARHPELFTGQDAWTRHIRFEIAEANAMSAVGSFGKMGLYTGTPFFPIMTVYDFFIKRALDQLYYNLYWDAEFVILGTPSGVTLSSEGAQHSWKSDIQIPNLLTWEPFYAQELDWIVCDAIQRHMSGDNKGRKGVLIRAVTRGTRQKVLLESLRKHAAFKADLPTGELLKPVGDAGQGVDESSLAPMADADINARLRGDVLDGGYYLLDWRGYEGYEPGDNVVHIFALGSLVTEALGASERLFDMGILANVIVITSQDLLLGIQGHETGYRHLIEGLGINANLHAVPTSGVNSTDIVSLAARRVPIVAVCDGEAGLVDNIGSIIGVKQRTLAVRKFSKCGRPSEVYNLQEIDAAAIVDACGQALSETALEDLQLSPALLQQLAGKPVAAKEDWRALWSPAQTQ
jgi:pyruvate dehydrogenase E1 component